jgi:hypothetical protein
MSLALTGRLARRASLLALGALALHQLRYALVYGGRTSAALEHQGHSYLGDLAPLLVALALSLLSARVIAAALGRLRVAGAREPGWRAEWAFFSAALVAIFSAQELVEGALSAGHPGGLAAVFGDGGAVAIPLALAIGALVALLDHFLSRAERSLVARAERDRRPAARPVSLGLPSAPLLAALAARPLAFGLARRPPPLLRP